MEQKIKKAIIPAAGLGTRFLPATKVLPKELLPIVDKPGIQLIVEEALEAGITEIILVISRDKEQIANHFRSSPVLEEHLQEKKLSESVDKMRRLVDQAEYRVIYQDKPLGLGHAVLCAREMVKKEWCMVLLPDDVIDSDVPCSLQMLRSWEDHKQALVAVMEVPWEEVHLYGVVKALPMADQLGEIEKVVEKPRREEAPSNLAIIGRYLLPPEIFDFLTRVKPGTGGEIQLTDALVGLVKKKGLYAFQFSGERFDVGNKFGFLEANLNYALKHEEIGPKTRELIHLIAESR